MGSPAYGQALRLLLARLKRLSDAELIEIHNTSPNPIEVEACEWELSDRRINHRSKV